MPLPFCVLAQPRVWKQVPPKYELEHIRLNNKEDIGLFEDVTEDKEGYLWLTGTKGLHVFDGSHTITYTNGDKRYGLAPDSLNKTLYAFVKSGNGNFWIQEENERLLLFEPAARKCTHIFSKKVDPDDKINLAATGNSDEYFISTVNHAKGTMAIWKINAADSMVKVYEATLDLNAFYFYTFAGGNHWIMKTGSIIRISPDGKEIKEYTMPGKTMLHSYPMVNNGVLYFIDNPQEAIYTWNTITDKFEMCLKLPPLVKGKAAGFLIRNHIFYLGSNLYFFILDTSNNTIQDLSPGFAEVAKKEAPNSLGINFMKFFMRSDSSLLACTQADIYRLKKKIPPEEQFRQTVKIVHPVSPFVSFRALAEDDKKNIYASYYTGISKKVPGSKEFIPIPVQQHIQGDFPSTYSLQYWKGHLLWNNVKIDVAKGIFRYMTGETFGGHCAQYLQNDTLWLFQWNTNVLHCFDLVHNILVSYELDKRVTNGTLQFGEINDMVADAGSQNLWISTGGDGILLISKKGKVLRQYKSQQLSIRSNMVTDLQQDGNDLWFGCEDGLGLLNIPTGKVVIYKDAATINNAIVKNRTIYSILADDHGNFYLGSDHGLLWFDTKGRAFYNLLKEHPLANKEFNRASVLRTSDNRYYLGTTDGLYSFMSAELEFFKSSNTLKPLKLYNVSIFNREKNESRYVSKDLNLLSSLVLSPFDNNIEFYFSVPEFYENIYYSYRIKGQNDKWSEYSPDNKILLYGLLPGRYTLEVKASTDLSDDNPGYYRLPLIVQQVWYKKWWVVGLFICFALALIVTAIRYRYKQKLLRQKDLANLRTKISSDLHDDVGSILSGLAMQSQMLTFTAKEEQKESLLQISNMSRDAMEHMRDTVWAIDSRKDKYENLIDRMRAFAEKNLPLKNMTHEFIIADIDTKKFIDPEKRQTIYLIFKEAITNIIKHSDGNHVTITFGQVKDNLDLIIHDNGPEKTNGNSDGLGLANMKMRAEKIGGHLNTKYDKGFMVELSL